MEKANPKVAKKSLQRHAIRFALFASELIKSAENEEARDDEFIFHTPGSFGFRSNTSFSRFYGEVRNRHYWLAPIKSIHLLIAMAPDIEPNLLLHLAMTPRFCSDKVKRVLTFEKNKYGDMHVGAAQIDTIRNLDSIFVFCQPFC